MKAQLNASQRLLHCVLITEVTFVILKHGMVFCFSSNQARECATKSTNSVSASQKFIHQVGAKKAGRPENGNWSGFVHGSILGEAALNLRRATVPELQEGMTPRGPLSV